MVNAIGAADSRRSQPIDDRDGLSVSPVSVLQYFIVDTDVLEALDYR